MNCYLHPETPATGYCRSCGRPLCPACQRSVEGVIYCQDHVPVPVYAADPAGGPGAPGPNPYAPPGPNPYAQPVGLVAPPGATSPVLAFILGWIPGVGAIYNGQYLKGLVHAIIFGLIVTLISEGEGSAEPLLGITLAAFVFYMPFEAFHTAKKRQMGLPVDEWSSFTTGSRFANKAPIGPIVLIVIGIIFLLNTLHLIEFREISRYWPVILIIVGVAMLYGRIAGLRSHRPYGSANGMSDTTAGDQMTGGRL